MTRPLLFVRPRELVEITLRTQEGRGLLRPSRQLTSLVLGVLAQCLALCRVELHAFIFLSNHGHLLATVENALHAAAFIRELKRRTSIRLERLLEWDGPVWDERTRPVPVLDDLAAVDRMRYVLSNGVKEGLVDHPLEWPGPSSTRALLTDMRIPAPLARTGEAQTIALAPLPPWARRTPDERRHLVQDLIDDVLEHARATRGGKPSLGVEGVLSLDPFRPIELGDKKPTPIAHASSVNALLDFVAARNAHASEYAESKARLLEAGLPVTFPQGSFLPPAGFEA